MLPAIDLLASGSRLALARALAAAPRSSGSELAAATDLHINTVRAQLRDLEAAGIVERAAERSGGRGRPTLRYRLREGAVRGGDELLGLASLLGGALSSARPKAEQLRRTGIEWGRRSRQGSSAAPERALEDALANLGFAVRVQGRRVELRGCPCPLVARDDPAVVCRLADAVEDGVLEGTSLRVAGREHDPLRRQCTATLAAAG